MKSRYISIYDEARGTLDYALALTASVDLLLADEAQLKLSDEDKQILQALRDKLKEEKSLTNVLTQLLIHFSQIDNKTAHDTLYYILKDLVEIHSNTRESNLVTPSPMAILIGEAEDHKQGEEWGVKVNAMLRSKNLNPAMFKRDPNLTINSDFAQHVKWAWENIYSIPYVGEKQTHPKIARYVHGIGHVTPVAMYVPVLANLYRRHGDKDAEQLTDEDIKLLMIAALLHDAARENEGEDLWDHESGIIIYMYLTRVCGADPEKAKMIACAVANKDINATGEFELYETDDGKDVHYRFNKRPDNEPPKKSIYQKIIHDADCLDIIRARAVFDANYQDFYQEIASKCDNNIPLDEMAQLITEVRHLVDLRGDSYNRTNPEVKLRYENAHAFLRFQVDIQSGQFPMLSSLGNKLIDTKVVREMTPVDLRPYQPELGLTDENFMAAIREGRVFARGVASPSAISNNQKETLAELELRKTMRQTGVETASSKSTRDKKHGNPLRSISMLGYGTRTFTNAGFLVIDPPLVNVKEISSYDFGTGRGKKKGYAQNMENNPGSISKKDETAKKEKLQQLNKKLKMGGNAYVSKHFDKYVANHSEVTCDLLHYDAIYISPDHNLYNMDVLGKADSFHRHSAIIQGIYLQKLYEQGLQKTRDKFIARFGEEEGVRRFQERFGEVRLLPIFVYSGIANSAHRLAPEEYTDEKLLTYWQQACSDYLTLAGKTRPLASVLFDLTLDSLKTVAVYGKEEKKYNDGRPYFSSSAPADSCYSPQLKAQLDNSLNEMLSAQRQLVLDALFQENSAYKLPGNEEELYFITLYAINNNQAELLSKLFAKFPDIAKITRDKKDAMEIFLTRAIELKNVEMVRNLLANMKGIKISGNIFHQAVELGNIEIVDLLLDHGADHEFISTSDNTALHTAARAGHLDVVMRLAGLTKNIDAKNKIGLTPLYFAAIGGHLSVVNYLLSQNADPNVLSSSGKTMLIDCIRGGNTDVVKALIANKADIQCSFENDFAIHVAAADGRTEIVAVLLEVCDVNAPNKNKSTPLHRAAKENKPEVVHLLLSRGATVDAENGAGATALEAAAEHGAIACVELLLSHEANPKHEFGSQLRWNALRLAAANGHTGVVKLLLQQPDMHVDSQDPSGLTPIYLAAERGRLETAEALLDAGARMDILFRNQYAPLHAAVEAKHVKIAALLLERGAVISADSYIIKMAIREHGREAEIVKLLESYCSITNAVRNNNVKALATWLNRGVDANTLIGDISLLATAAQNGNIEMVALLLERGAKVQNVGRHNPMEVATHPDIIKLLLQHGADSVNTFTDDGLCPLMKAVKNDRVKTTESLLKCDADPNIHSLQEHNLSRTPLHIAATWHRLRCTHLLLACPTIKVDERDSDGRTALHLAVNPDFTFEKFTSSWLETTNPALHANEAIIACLILNKSDVNARDKDGMTPLAVAAKALNYNAVLSLLMNGADLETKDDKGLSVFAHAQAAYIKEQKATQKNRMVGVLKSADESCATLKLLRAHKDFTFAVKHISGSEAVTSVMKRCKDVNVVDHQGSSLLHLCVADSKTWFLTPILETPGVNIEARDNQGKTPLMIAVMNNNRTAVEALLKRGADISAKDKDGKTAEDFLGQRSSNDFYGSLWGRSREDDIKDLLEEYKLKKQQPTVSVAKTK